MDFFLTSRFVIRDFVIFHDFYDRAPRGGGCRMIIRPKAGPECFTLNKAMRTFRIKFRNVLHLFL